MYILCFRLGGTGSPCLPPRVKWEEDRIKQDQVFVGRERRGPGKFRSELENWKTELGTRIWFVGEGRI